VIAAAPVSTLRRVMSLVMVSSPRWCRFGFDVVETVIRRAAPDKPTL
jgi:hypothetical protein